MRKLIFIPLLFATIAATAQAQKQAQKKRHAEAAIITSGNSLFDLCQHLKTDRAKGELGVACLMYISGVTQTLLLNSDTETMKFPCPGKMVTEEQIADVVIKWMDDHPEKRDLPAPFIIMKGLSEAFPCN